MQICLRQVTKGPTDTRCWGALLWRANHPMNGQSLFGGWKGLRIRMSDFEQIWLKKNKKNIQNPLDPSLPPPCVPLPCPAFHCTGLESQHPNGCIHSCRGKSCEQWWFRLLWWWRGRINDPLWHLSTRLWLWDYGCLDPQREETTAITYVRCSRLVIRRK